MELIDKFENSESKNTSAIQKFFETRAILVTGATGFVGKVLLEKLLRDCPHVETIYILIRPKRGKDINLRTTEMLSKPLFKKINPKMLQKVVPVEGDIGLPELGLSVENQQKLCDNVSIVIHSAATVKFTEKLKISFDLNLNGTKRVVDLCRRIKNLAVLVYVSTAYANCNRSTVEEIVYSMPVKAEEIENMDDATAESRTKELLGKRPNTYTFTKALTECYLETVSSELPICIVRPSVVTASWRDPLPGWIDSFGGVSTLIAIWGSGICRSAIISVKKHVDLIPVDLLVNHILAATWCTAEFHGKSKLRVYNCCTGNSKPLLWGTMERLCNKILFKIPFNGAVLYPHMVFQSNSFTNWIAVFFFHLIPGSIMDFGALVTCQKRRGLKSYQQVKQFQKVSTWISTNEWNFVTNNSVELHNLMSEADRSKFNFQIKDLDWRNYFEDYCAGVRQYLLKQDPSTIPVVRRKTRTTFIIKQCCQVIMLILILCGVLYFVFILTRFFSKPNV